MSECPVAPSSPAPLMTQHRTIEPLTCSRSRVRPRGSRAACLRWPELAYRPVRMRLVESPTSWFSAACRADSFPAELTSRKHCSQRSTLEPHFGPQMLPPPKRVHYGLRRFGMGIANCATRPIDLVSPFNILLATDTSCTHTTTGASAPVLPAPNRGARDVTPRTSMISCWAEQVKKSRLLGAS